MIKRTPFGDCYCVWAEPKLYRIMVRIRNLQKWNLCLKPAPVTPNPSESFGGEAWRISGELPANGWDVPKIRGT